MCFGVERRGEEAFFTADILACHSRKSTGVDYKFNDGWNPFKAALISGSWCRACWLTVTHSVKHTAIVSVIRDTCAFPTISQNVCCENVLLKGMDGPMKRLN